MTAPLTGQLELDLDVVHAREDDLTDAERAAIQKDFVNRFSDTRLTEEGLRAKPCVCEGHSLVMLDALAVERRCALCGRRPRA